MVLCRTFHTTPKEGQEPTSIVPIVLVLVPVPVPDTDSVITLLGSIWVHKLSDPHVLYERSTITYLSRRLTETCRRLPAPPAGCTPLFYRPSRSDHELRMRCRPTQDQMTNSPHKFSPKIFKENLILKLLVKRVGENLFGHFPLRPKMWTVCPMLIVFIIRSSPFMFKNLWKYRQIESEYGRFLTKLWASSNITTLPCNSTLCAFLVYKCRLVSDKRTAQS